MIRINLLKKPTKRKRPAPTAVIAVAGGLIGLILLAGGAWYGLKSVRMKPEPEPYFREENFLPSTHRSGRIVEEVVREIRDNHDKLQKRGFLDLPYEELSFIEKINYEIQFAHNVCALLARAIPASVGLRTMEGRKDRTVYCEGLAGSREPVSTALKGIRDAGARILDDPLTRITPRGDGFQFAATCHPEFGLDLTAPFLLGLDDLPRRDQLEGAIGKIRRAASRSGVRLATGPTRTEAMAIGRYRRIHYTLAGQATYQEFVAFVEALLAERVPCAFNEFRLAATSRNSVSVKAELVFTTVD